MYFIRIILTIMIGLTLASHPHAVAEAGLTEGEERSTGDGTLDDDVDLAQGSGDGQQNNAAHATDDSGRLVQGNLAQNGTYGSKSSDPLRNRDTKAENRQRKSDQLTRGGKSPSVDGTATSKRDKIKKKGKANRGRDLENTVTPPRNLPELRALPRTECPCRKWIPDWDNYSAETFNENGTLAAYLCSKTQTKNPEITEIIAWLYNVDGGPRVKATVDPSIGCEAHFSGVKNGSYAIQAIAYCPAFLDKNDGDEKICDSGSKFSKTFSVVEPPTSEELKDESPDSLTPVLLGCAAGLVLVSILTALICVVRRKIQCKHSSHSSTTPNTTLEAMNLSKVSRNLTDIGNLTSSWITLDLTREESTGESSFQDDPSQEEISLCQLPGSTHPDGQSTPQVLTTTSFVQVAANQQGSQVAANQQRSQVAANQQGSAISKNPSEGSTRDLTGQPPGDSRCVQINPALGIKDLDLNNSPGIIYGPKNDVIKGRFVPLHPSVLPPKETYKIKKITADEKFDYVEKLNSVETKQLYYVENEPLISAEKEPLCDTEKEPLYNSENEHLHNTEKDRLYNTDKDVL